ncbi:uncharacterized protein LODBEIA_P58450 [Lodderomyces beijingensis]|uniref:F-box domain-containing protein n=1 Tax=Lodderomyces beijingensis TaxID=1775926 RepID=A0ABP0ZU04_9ASCO
MSHNEASTNTMSLLDLPANVLANIISYLPQQSLINLATTNYAFYRPCLRKLYSHIVVSEAPPLRSGTSSDVQKKNKKKQDPPGSRKEDFQDSTQTVIYGFRSRRYAKLNLQMIYARLVVLLQALEINQELIGFVKKIHVFGKLNREIFDVVRRLSTKFVRLDCFYIEHQDEDDPIDTRHLDPTSHYMRDLDLEVARGRITELTIAIPAVPEGLAWLDSITSLSFGDNPVMTSWWINGYVERKLPPFKSLRKFRWVFHPALFDAPTGFLKLIPWEQLQQLELVFSYDEHALEDYLTECWSMIPESSLPCLQKLSIKQGAVYPTHAANEMYDLMMFKFLTHVASNLQYLSIRHALPPLGNFSDGVEGNYRRRYEMYIKVLPKIITRSSTANDFILSLPNLFQTFACYEQYMNTVLYNGCKCEYCNYYLSKLDKFLMHHKYYDHSTNRYKDMNASHLFSAIGRNLSKRMDQDKMVPQLDMLSYPLWDDAWDFHKVDEDAATVGAGGADLQLLKPFKCYDEEVIDQGEYDEDPTDQEATDISPNCEFGSELYSKIPKCIGHYTNDMIQEILNLHRGNAEQRVDEQEDGETIGNGDNNKTEANFDHFKDGGDSDTTHRFNIRRIYINGIVYNIGSELNGTHYYVNVYDDDDE